MARETWTIESFWAELDKIGEHEVRVRLATKIYGDLNEKGGLAREWLLRKELAQAAESSRKAEASEAAKMELAREQVRIARSAKNIAIIAAIISIAAVTANIIMFVMSMAHNR